MDYKNTMMGISLVMFSVHFNKKTSIFLFWEHFGFSLAAVQLASY